MWLGASQLAHGWLLVEGFATHQLNSQLHCICWLLIIPFHTWKPDFQGARRQMSSADSRRAMTTLAPQFLDSTSSKPPVPSAEEPQLLSYAELQLPHWQGQTFWGPPSITQTPMSEPTALLPVCCWCRDTKHSHAKVVPPSAVHNTHTDAVQRSV